MELIAHSFREIATSTGLFSFFRGDLLVSYRELIAYFYPVLSYGSITVLRIEGIILHIPFISLNYILILSALLFDFYLLES